MLVDRPDEIGAVHRDYLAAGSDCISTASYQATVSGFMGYGHDRTESLELLRRATRVAVAAVDASCGTRSPSGETEPRPLVAASVGSYGAYLGDGSEYDGRYEISDDELRAFHAERFRVLAGSGADLLACETIPSAREATVLLQLLSEMEEAWAWFTFSCPDGRTIWDGTSIEDVASRCAASPRVAGVGINCTDPQFVGELTERIGTSTELPIIVYPNSGERYDPVGKSWAETEDGSGVTWLGGVEAAWRAGARVIGGCCRTGPKEIAELRARLAGGDFSAGYGDQGELR